MTNLDNLFNYINSTDLLTTARAGGQLPIYLYAYPATQEDEMSDLIVGLKSRLTSSGKSVIHKDIFEMVVDILKENGEFTSLLIVEPDTPKWDVADHINAVADFTDMVLPRIKEEIELNSSSVVFLSGIAKCYPFLRTKGIIEGLEIGLSDTPVVLFFPGTYDGWTMLLFGTVHEHSYRAINLSGQLDGK
ncbi:MAG: DUF1788 domain-containing protein [Ignavibacteriales bacterium]|nr:DUF1788 domain-containing protein [Ignavibacteriales bacterium]